MTIELWLAFLATVVFFALIPGPTVIFVIGQALAHGKTSVAPIVVGVLCGDFVAMLLSILGLGAILSTSATLFIVLKWFGVGYLVYLGCQTWRKEPERQLDLAALQDNKKSKHRLFSSAFLVTALNPKSIVFFVAFLPHFINPEAEALPQLFILMATFLATISVTISGFTLCSGLAGQRLRGYAARKKVNRISGGALIGAGVLTSVVQRQ